MWNKTFNTLKSLFSAIGKEHSFLSDVEVTFIPWMQKYLDTFRRRIKTNGKQWTLDRYKAINLSAKQYASNIDVTPVPFSKCKVDNLPMEIHAVRRFLKGSNPVMTRMVLTVTRVYETIYTRPVIDLEAILARFKGRYSIKVAINHYSLFLEIFSIKRFGTYSIKPTEKFIERSKAGPNGPSVAASHLDTLAVHSDKRLFNALERWNKLMNQHWLNDYFRWNLDQLSDVKTKQVYTGKLGSVSEPAGKTRLFAYGDYWRANALLPMHDSLMQILRNLGKVDATYDQHKGFARLKEVRAKQYFCFDLKKASDRLPVALQLVLISKLFSKEISGLWWQLMVRPAFWAPSIKRYVRWRVGQPLGLLSSWPAFALFHHTLVWMAARDCQIREWQKFSAYIILGDDIVIWHHGVATRYQAILEEFGVDISIEKSFIGKPEDGVYEFCRRNSVNYEEISGLSWPLLIQSTKSIYNLVDLIVYMVESNWPITYDTDLVPPYLSLRGKDLLNFLLWEKGRSEPALSGYTDFMLPSLAEVRQRVLELRKESLEENSKQISKQFSQITLETYMRKEGLPVGVQTVSFKSYPRHPMCEVLSSIQHKMTEAISEIVLFEHSSFSDWSDTPELLDVEYLPLPTKGLYFSPKRGNPLSRKKHSQFVLSAIYLSQQVKKVEASIDSSKIDETSLFLFDDSTDDWDTF